MAKFVFLAAVFISIGCQSAHPVPANTSLIEDRPAKAGASEPQGLKSVQEIAKFAWVNKRCRQWAADGDIDIDQTCLVVNRVGGGLVVIPNEYNDDDLKETLDNIGKEDKDKWLLRFYSIGGGEKTKR
jgi:hypothetical protein